MATFKMTKSPAMALALHQMGIESPIDAIYHLPRRYEVLLYTPKKPVYEDKERLVLLCKIVGKAKVSRFSHRELCTFSIETVDGQFFDVDAWNRGYLAKTLNNEDYFTVSGSYDKKHGHLSLINIVKGRIERKDAIKPIYTLPSAIPNHVFASLVRRCLNYLSGRIENQIPRPLMDKYRLADTETALRMIHFPSSQKDMHDGWRVIKYKEALEYELKVQVIKGQNRALTKDPLRRINKEKLERFVTSLPYGLTSSQRETIEECISDMDSRSVMYRLLQGDVGTGKTLVAALLAYANHLRSEQTAILAPTDALARQHYENLKRLYEGTRTDVSLLVGSMPISEKNAVLRDLEDGTADIVVGTHALFSKNVKYAYLGLVIIDEQHKFGVNQRTLLLDKGENSDLLLMSATPIPRTLSLTLYGDLDVSTLTEFPSGKRTVETLIMMPGSKKLYEAIDKSISSGHRVYVVAPQIEEKGDDDDYVSAKEVYKEYEALYPGKTVLMHGKQDEESKEVALLAFKSGICPILVATSLIEVGIDVKEADTMIIHSPTHFALSSLHQLRGRIGRDGSKATCILAYQGNDESEREKLDILIKSDDGFKIAEEDLRLRGPGDIVGTRQSGLPSFAALNVIDDFRIFECARDDASRMLKDKDNPEYANIIEKAMKDTSSGSLA